MKYLKVYEEHTKKYMPICIWIGEGEDSWDSYFSDDIEFDFDEAQTRLSTMRSDWEKNQPDVYDHYKLSFMVIPYYKYVAIQDIEKGSEIMELLNDNERLNLLIQSKKYNL